MRLTIIPIDKTIGIDGTFLSNVEGDLSWIPTNIHAVQWYDTWGEIEYNDGSPNEKIEELGIYELVVNTFDAENQRIINEQIAREEAIESARDYWKELRIFRNQRLSECDWTQVTDVQLTDEQKISWKSYRQALRDLPENIIDPKPMVLDLNHLNWPIPPI